MINSRSFRQRERRAREAAEAKPITHSEIMARRGQNKSISAPGDLKSYKGGKRVGISENKDYKAYTYTMPGSNGSGSYKITSGYQTLLLLDGVLFVTKSNKSGDEKITLRSGDFVTFKKSDVVSFCPNAASMRGILIESAEIKTKKVSDPIVNNTGLEVYNSVRDAKRTNERGNIRKRKEKTAAEREAYGHAYMAARGIKNKGPAVVTNAAGQVKNPNQAKDLGKVKVKGEVNPAASVVEGENPMPMVIEEDK